MTSVEDLLEFVGPGVATEQQARHAIATAEGLVEAYTRGRHVTADGGPRPGVDAVVLQVAARLAANPSQIQTREQVGPYSLLRSAGFQGFTLTEQLVLNRYRKRAL